MEEHGKYKQLQPEERVSLASLRQQGAGVREIARRLERSPATISREIRRNTRRDAAYASAQAQTLAGLRRRVGRGPGKLAVSGSLWPVVCSMLRMRYSPEQVAGILKQSHPDEKARRVSHETIYTTIYAHAKGELRKELIGLLRQRHSKRMPRSRGEDRRKSTIADMVSIHVRPPEASDRAMPGHWEGDLIKGKANRSAVGVLVERSSRLVVLARMPDASAQSALAAFTVKLREIPEPLRKTLTYDRGTEMARHRELAEQTGMRVYFCDPHSPWQRPTCENTNGLLRQYLPKGTDLSVYTQAELDEIADSMNTRPRKTLGWRTPLQVYQQFLQAGTVLATDELAA